MLTSHNNYFAWISRGGDYSLTALIFSVMLSISNIIININFSNEHINLDEQMHIEHTINEVIQEYLDSVALSRSENTARTYKNALNVFCQVLMDNDLNPDESQINDLSEDAVTWFAAYLKSYSPTTERLYLTAAAVFYEYLAAERLSEPNLPRVRMLIRQRARRDVRPLPSHHGLRR